MTIAELKEIIADMEDDAELKIVLPNGNYEKIEITPNKYWDELILFITE